MNVLQELKNRIDQADLWGKDISLGRKEYLKVNGSIDSNLYLIVSGSLRIYFEDEYEEQIIRLGYQGNIIGALDSFLSDQPSEFFIQAIKKCELKVVKKSTFLNFIQEDSANLILWQKVLEMIIFEQLQREKDILTYSPIKRYQSVLKRSPQLFQEIPNKYIASYLRMSPETLSRLKKS